MKRSLRFTARSKKDYAGIIRRSKAVHGPAAANRYALLLEKAFEAIANNPAIGKSLPMPLDQAAMSLHLRSVKRQLPKSDQVGSPRHLVIYFAIEEDAVVISRILHDAMDLQLHELPKKADPS